MEARVTHVATDRRRNRRHADHDIVSARVRPGYDVVVLDASAGGLLIEGSHRLLPGTRVELQLLREGQPAESVRGHVVRCSVARLWSNAVSYRGAIVFERPLPCFSNDESREYGVPTSKSRGSGAPWADATRHAV